MKEKNYVRAAFFKHDFSLLLNAITPLSRRSTAHGRPFQGFWLWGHAYHALSSLLRSRARAWMRTEDGRSDLNRCVRFDAESTSNEYFLQNQGVNDEYGYK